MHRLGLRARPVLVALGAPPDRLLRLDLEPDPEVPVSIDLGPEGEDAVDDQHGIVSRRRDHVGVVELGERIDAAQHAGAGALGRGRLQPQPGGVVVVEGVAVVARSGLPVVAMPLPPRPLEVVQAGPKYGTAGLTQVRGELMAEAGLAGRRTSVDADPEALRPERLDA